MKKRFKILCLFLTCMMSVSALLVGCSGDKKESSSSGGGEPTQQEPSLPLSDHYLVKNGRTDYKLVYPAEADVDSYDMYAVYEFQYFFKEATGLSIEAVPDTGLTYSANASYISIGNNDYLESADIDIDYSDLKVAGYVLVSKGKSVFCTGNLRGALNAVYRFFKEQFNYEIYAIDEIRLNRTTEDCRLYQYDLKEIPIVSTALGVSTEADNDTNYGLRMGFQLRYEALGPQNPNGTLFHNFTNVVSPSIYNDPEGHPDTYHPEWFSNSQLNLSSETNDLLIDVVVDYFKKCVIESDEKLLALAFTTMDKITWSTAESSKELEEKYGTPAGEYILFMNECARRFNPWLEENYPDKEVKLCLMAYHKTLTPPIKTDEKGEPIRDANGNYLPYGDEVVLEDNLYVMYTTLFSSMYFDMYDEHCEYNLEELKKWNTLSQGKNFLWLYSSHFEDQLVPIDTVNRIANDMKLCSEFGADLIFYDIHYGQGAVNGMGGIYSDWCRLKTYLFSKLRWDYTLNVDDLIDDFFLNYFKDAAEPMRKFFDEERAWMKHVAENDPTVLYAYTCEWEMYKGKYWPEQVLRRWLGYIDEAKAAIEPLKETDIELYDKLLKRINIESGTIRYLLLRNYSTSFRESYEAEVLSLIDDLMSAGCIYANHNSLVQDYLMQLIS